MFKLGDKVKVVNKEIWYLYGKVGIIKCLYEEGGIAYTVFPEFPKMEWTLYFNSLERVKDE